MARRRFFVPSIQQGHAVLIGDEAEHLTRVLRVEKGQVFEISDNQQLYLAEVDVARKVEVSFRILEELPTTPEPLDLRLYCALIKYDRLEWIFEKATELGVTSIHLVIAERSEKGLELAALKRLPRWQRILQEASQQSRRLRLPVLHQPLALKQTLAATALVEGQKGARLFLDEQATAPLLASLPAAPQPNDPVALLLGPEGGWADRERDVIVAAHWTPVSLGPNILRAETAATAALAIVRAFYQSQLS